MVQLSYLYMSTEKTIALTIQTFVNKVLSLFFNILCRFVITFIPRSKYLLISWLQPLSALILKPEKINMPLFPADDHSNLRAWEPGEPTVLVAVWGVLILKSEDNQCLSLKKVRQGEIFFSAYWSKVFNGLEEAHLHLGKKYALFSLCIQMLISSTNALIDTLRQCLTDTWGILGWHIKLASQVWWCLFSSHAFLQLSVECWDATILCACCARSSLEVRKLCFDQVRGILNFCLSSVGGQLAIGLYVMYELWINDLMCSATITYYAKLLQSCLALCDWSYGL